jgi:hypothetical protein
MDVSEGNSRAECFRQAWFLIPVSSIQYGHVQCYLAGHQKSLLRANQLHQFITVSLVHELLMPLDISS